MTHDPVDGAPPAEGQPPAEGTPPAEGEPNTVEALEALYRHVFTQVEPPPPESAP